MFSIHFSLTCYSCCMNWIYLKNYLRVFPRVFSPNSPLFIGKTCRGTLCSGRACLSTSFTSVSLVGELVSVQTVSEFQKCEALVGKISIFLWVEAFTHPILSRRKLSNSVDILHSQMGRSMGLRYAFPHNASPSLISLPLVPG